MTEKGRKQVAAMRQILGEEVKKWLARLVIWVVIWGGGGALAYMFTPLWDRLQAIWESPITQDAILSEMREVRQEQREVRAELQRATGEDRVLRMIPGLSYVSEPVRQGETVILNLVAQRTRLGAGCRLVSGISLFTDENGVTLAGSPLRPVRQIGTDQMRLRIELTTPPTLRPGRTALHLELEYSCAGSPVYDSTEPVIFYLLPAE